MCGFSHTIMGRVEGDRIIIRIETPCEKFRELTCLNTLFRNCPGIKVVSPWRWKDKRTVHLNVPGNAPWTARGDA